LEKSLEWELGILGFIEIKNGAACSLDYSGLWRGWGDESGGG